MRGAAFVLGLAASVSAYNSKFSVEQQWNDFVSKYAKEYGNAEELSFRKGVFAANLARVIADNAELVEQGHDAVHGVTKFMDLTQDEFKEKYLMKDYQPLPRLNEKHFTSDKPLADSVDWRTKNVITAVKDQGQCGSCWAFSATEAIESYNALAGNSLVELSAQQINACDKTDAGCNGGNTETAYQYVVSAGGLESEADYPYTSGTGLTGFCRFKAANVAVKITGYTPVGTGEANLATALNDGPVSVCLAANAFQTYTGGVLTACPGQIDHCVQAVGYTADAWIVRNSWNTDWGEEGYIRVARGKNLCKISNDVTFPTFAAATTDL